MLLGHDADDQVMAVLDAQIRAHPAKTALIFLAADGVASEVTYTQLSVDLRRTAAVLGELGVREGEVVLLAFPHSYTLITTFLGAIYRGAVPAILPYFDTSATPDAYSRQVPRTVEEVHPQAILTLPELAPALTHVLAHTGCPVLAIDAAAVTATPVTPWQPAQRGGEDAVHLQISSGTTGQPKAVIVTHRALLHYIESMRQPLAFTEADVSVNWVPLSHDLGLIGEIYLPLLSGASSVLMSSAQWLRRPHLLLQAIHRYRGTTSAMPNFAFVHCTRHIRDRDIVGVDLSSCRVIVNGAERISLDSMQVFYARFASYGLRDDVFTPAYGMAEYVASVSLKPAVGQPAVDWLSLAHLHHTGRALPLAPSTPEAKPIVSCGVPIPETNVAIVDEHNQFLGERHVGEIVIKGVALCADYYGRPDLDFVDADGWFHTGDIGYLANGELYVCDRKKDLIIVGGHNVHPANLETVGYAVLGPAVSVCVAIGIPDEALGTERPILICGLNRQADTQAMQTWELAIRQRALQDCGVALADVYFVPRGWVLRTPSGKISRVANREKYVSERGLPAPAQRADLDLEQRVTEIYKAILGVSALNSTDSFFALGGDSLSALHLLLEIESQFGREISAEFFQTPTVAHLVELLERPVDDPKERGEFHGPQGFPGYLLRRQQARSVQPWWRDWQMALIYPNSMRLLAGLCQQPWAQLLFWKKRRWLIRHFYATLDAPAPSQGEVLALSLMGHVGSGYRVQALLDATGEQFDRYVTFSGEVYLKQALERGRGVLLLGYHSYPETSSLIVSALWRHGYANLYAMTLGDFDALFEQPAPKPDDLRNRDSTTQWAEHLVQTKQLLMSNYIVLAAADAQGGNSPGVVLPLHNRLWTFKQGFAELALSTGATILPMSTAMDSAGCYEIKLHPPFETDTLDDRRQGKRQALLEQCRTFLQTAWAERPWTVMWEAMGAHLWWPPS